MTDHALLILTLTFFLTSIIGVVTGSNSLITVPVMLGVGMKSREAVATNMFALTFLSIGGSLSFLTNKAINTRKLPALIGLTLAGSAIGALLVLVVSAQTLRVLIPFFMIALAIFVLVNRNAGITSAPAVSPNRTRAGYLATFLLGIYGGFFSGGYVTLLTAAYVALFGMSFLESVSITKIINVFSSLVATGIFMWQGLVDYKLGLGLGVIMFVGAVIGAKITLRLNNVLIRNIFLAVVLLLAMKALIWDINWNSWFN